MSALCLRALFERTGWQVCRNVSGLDHDAAMKSRKMHAVQRCEEEEAWTTIDTTNTRIAKEPVRVNPVAGLVPAAHLPVRDGVAPPRRDPTHKAARQVAVARPIKDNPAHMSAAMRQRREAARQAGNTTAMSEAPRKTATAPRKGKQADMNAAPRKTAAASHKGKQADTNAAPRLAGAALPAPVGLRPPPAPAEAEDTALPAVPPAHPKSARKNAVTASAFNQGHFSSSRLRWLSSR